MPQVLEEGGEDRHSQVKEHQAGSQQRPGFHREVRDQVQCCFFKQVSPLTFTLSCVCICMEVWACWASWPAQLWFREAGLQCFKCWERRWGSQQKHHLAHPQIQDSVVLATSAAGKESRIGLLWSLNSFGRNINKEYALFFLCVQRLSLPAETPGKVLASVLLQLVHRVYQFSYFNQLAVFTSLALGSKQAVSVWHCVQGVHL